MEQILNKLNIHGEEIPFLTFKTDTTRTTPNKHKAKYICLSLDPKFIYNTEEQEREAQSPSATT